MQSIPVITVQFLHSPHQHKVLKTLFVNISKTTGRGIRCYLNLSLDLEKGHSILPRQLLKLLITFVKPQWSFPILLKGFRHRELRYSTTKTLTSWDRRWATFQLFSSYLTKRRQYDQFGNTVSCSHLWNPTKQFGSDQFYF